MAESPVPAALQAAYRATTYRVWLPEGAVDLREGEACPALAAYVAARGGRAWMVVTASNPASEPLGEAANLARQRALAGLLHSLGLPALAAENLADDGQWPAEAGFFVTAPVLDRELALALGRHMGQNAVLFGVAQGDAGTPDTTPELLWCREVAPPGAAG